MKTSELIGPAPDWAVAKCEGYTPIDHSCLATIMVERKNARGVMQPEHISDLRYSTNWAQSGPIIEREKISTIFHDGFYAIPNTWFAYKDFYYDGMEVSSKHDMQGNTPLIAAMRCYVASKLGDEVHIPRELE